MARSDNPTVRENQNAGTLDWQLQYTRFDDAPSMAGYPMVRRLRSSRIEGYVSRTSVRAGESLDVFVSLDPPGRFVIDFYRMGYYGGTGGRHMARIGSFAGTPQPMPMMTVERLRECRWEKVTTFPIPGDWPSGVYLGKLTRDEPFGAQSYLIFVVKAHRPTDLLCMASDLTWQAYNKWPGKNSLYDDGTPQVWYVGPNVRVSFDRPYAKYCQILDAPLSAGSGEFLLWEHPMAFWLEEQGYDVTYCSNLDLELDPAILKTAKALVSVAHDEYWSRGMFGAATKARDEGLSLAFFSGNAVCYETLLYDGTASGAPCRAMARQKRYEDEDTLMGVKSYGTGYGDWVVTRPEHWIYEGTGLGEGDRIRGLIGWEYHGTPAPIPGLEVVAASQLGTGPGRPDNPRQHAAVTYPGPKGNWVFNAGTIWWPEGLSCPPGHNPARTSTAGTFGVDARVQRISANVLDRMVTESCRK